MNRNIPVYMDRYTVLVYWSTLNVIVQLQCLNCCQFIIHCYFDFFYENDSNVSSNEDSSLSE